MHQLQPMKQKHGSPPPLFSWLVPSQGKLLRLAGSKEKGRA